MKRLTAFTWGYWGWGTHTKDFVRAVDAIERDRGWRPPHFVDIRFSRSVRAVGFRQNAFSQTTGARRYHWMRKLGNSRVGSGTGGTKIKDPSAAEDLLDLIIKAYREKRRVIFFCSCDDARGCHRMVVARILRKAGARRSVELTTIEWPGGDATTAEVEVPAKVIKGVLNGATRVPLGKPRGTARRKLVALPWYSRVKLSSPSGDIAIISGPAKLGREWYLLICGPRVSKPTDSLNSLKAEAARSRKYGGYDPSHT